MIVEDYEAVVRSNGELTVKQAGWDRGWVSLGRVNRPDPDHWQCSIPNIWSVWGNVSHAVFTHQTRREAVEQAVEYVRKQRYIA